MPRASITGGSSAARSVARTGPVPWGRQSPNGQNPTLPNPNRTNPTDKPRSCPAPQAPQDLVFPGRARRGLRLRREIFTAVKGVSRHDWDHISLDLISNACDDLCGMRGS
ncbi:MAG: hypothetical protein FWD57_00605 [Polyangiaceae bacterium]|nr:hypothetical protein [Polyangiaceae bacterium]